MKINNLQDLFLEELQDLYDAEQQLLKAMPQLLKAVTSPDLLAALEDHQEETKEHVARLESIFENYEDVSPKGKRCKGMAGLIEEAKELLTEDIAEEVLDAAIIGAVQRMEHYEIAAYGCVCTYADLLGNEDEAEILEQTLDEERDIDERLTDMAESVINIEAMEDEEDEETAVDSEEDSKKSSPGS